MLAKSPTVGLGDARLTSNLEQLASTVSYMPLCLSYFHERSSHCPDTYQSETHYPIMCTQAPCELNADIETQEDNYNTERRESPCRAEDSRPLAVRVRNDS